MFKSGSVAVESKGREALKLLADVLNKNTDIDVLIEGIQIMYLLKQQSTKITGI